MSVGVKGVKVGDVIKGIYTLTGRLGNGLLL
jgi:hypothetical protein